MRSVCSTEQHNPDVITTHFMDNSLVNLGEEVIRTLLWQSGASESATVCLVISLSICYWLFKCWVLALCVWDREREGGSQNRVCERGRGSQNRVCERGRQSHNRGLCANTYELHHCVCHATLFPFRLELKRKLRTSLTVFNFILKAKIMERGVKFPTHACGVRPITKHCVSWPIRADCACQKEGLCRKWSRGIERTLYGIQCTVFEN